MPFDLSSRRKLYPDAMYAFRWSHEESGTVAARNFHTLGTIACEGQPDHAQAAAQGYSCSFSDWRDVEQKVYFDTEEDTGNSFITLYVGGLGSEASPCTGYGYEANFNTNGIVRLRKKMYHVQYYTIAEKDNGPLPATGQLKGVALCRYNIAGNRAVRLECWVDKSDKGFWKRALFAVDNGFNYGGKGGRCGSINDKEAFTWGFPVVAFSAPFTFTFEDMTARAINPGGSFNESGAGGGQARARGGGGSIPLPTGV